MKRGREHGQITVLTVGFLLILGLVTVLVVNASASFLERRELLSIADRAALTAADGLARDRLYRQGVDHDVPIDTAEAQRLAAAVVPTDTALHVRVDGGAVHVRLERFHALPITPPGWRDGARIVAESTAQLRATQDP
ncbi:pilus assembly protein TadG-related protein [uncultured Aeromicrobium sp.]|uniref:pilus assembly protein TadG-related protein n=1 Tax=uncultured Aeromicrobium sp. TaxID=337820 RepID=UPI0025E2948F|nr:pilus assembly protein TadG-related protein [uncultured Aeromicrobium sp.]